MTDFHALSLPHFPLPHFQRPRCHRLPGNMYAYIVVDRPTDGESQRGVVVMEMDCEHFRGPIFKVRRKTVTHTASVYFHAMRTGPIGSDKLIAIT